MLQSTEVIIQRNEEFVQNAWGPRNHCSIQEGHNLLDYKGHNMPWMTQKKLEDVFQFIVVTIEQEIMMISTILFLFVFFIWKTYHIPNTITTKLKTWKAA